MGNRSGGLLELAAAIITTALRAEFGMMHGLPITIEAEIGTMYVPDLFGSASPSDIQEIVETYSFATLITVRGDELQISHLPLVLEGNARRWRAARPHGARQSAAGALYLGQESHRDFPRSARLRVAGLVRAAGRGRNVPVHIILPFHECNSSCIEPSGISLQ